MKHWTLCKNDILLMVGILAAAILGIAVNFMTPAEKNGYVTIIIDGQIDRVCALNEDQTFEINHGTNQVRISNGSVRMTESDCPDQICVHHKSIAKKGESIICLPNKILLQIEGAEAAEFDAVTN